MVRDGPEARRSAPAWLVASLRTGRWPVRPPDTGLAGDGILSTISSNGRTASVWPCLNAVSKPSFVPPKAAAEFIRAGTDGPPIRLGQCALWMPLSYGARAPRTRVLTGGSTVGDSTWIRLQLASVSAQPSRNVPQLSQSAGLVVHPAIQPRCTVI
jgi:hypothetical protein